MSSSGAPRARRVRAAARASVVWKAMCCGLGTAGAPSPRRSSAALMLIRTCWAESLGGWAPGAGAGPVGWGGRGEWRGREPWRTLGRAGRVGAVHGQRADRGRAAGRLRAWCRVQQDPGVSLLPQGNRLGAVLSDVDEAE